MTREQGSLGSSADSLGPPGFGAALEAIPAAVVVVDGEGRIVFANAMAREVFGYAPKELMGGMIERLVPEPVREAHVEERRAYLEVPTARAMGEGRDLHALHSSGRHIPVEIGLHPLELEGTRFVLAAVVDLTHRRELEDRIREHGEELEAKAESLREARDALEQSNLELQRFAHVASHDLQAPLRNITGFAQLLQRDYADRLDEKGREYLQHILDGTAGMKALVDSLLGYSRVESRVRALEPTDLNEVMKTVTRSLAFEIEGEDARITWDELPTVQGDEGQLVQLLQNLVSNALQYRGEDPPRIHVSVQDHQGARIFSVRDNGIGIPEEARAEIFEIFKRLHKQSDHPGTGIGLAVCRRVVERHGGRIWVESEPGSGSTFYFSLWEGGSPDDGAR